MKIKHGPDIIPFTKVALPFGWLGNMAPYPVQYDGVTWKTTEHLFQALRYSEGSPVREEIRIQKSPMGAKMKAKKHKSERIVEQLSEQDIENMCLCLKLKIEAHPQLKEWLLSTDEKTIIEDTSSRPRKNDAWGMVLSYGVWEGENLLGNMWMALRKKLRSNTK